MIEIVPARLTIEVRGAATERDHLDALRVVRRRLGSRWAAPSLFLGGPALIVVMTLLGGRSLEHALIGNAFWLVFGPLMLFVGLPLATRQTVRTLPRRTSCRVVPLWQLASWRPSAHCYGNDLARALIC